MPIIGWDKLAFLPIFVQAFSLLSFLITALPHYTKSHEFGPIINPKSNKWNKIKGAGQAIKVYTLLELCTNGSTMISLIFRQPLSHSMKQTILNINVLLIII